jgi:hypothetical protein
MASVGLAYGAQGVVEIEHDWGYYAVKSLMGQSENTGQSIGSCIILAFEISPIIAGLVFGYLRRAVKAPSWWRIPPTLLACWMLGQLIFSRDHDGGDHSLWFWALLSPVLFLACERVGEIMFRQIARRNRPWPVILPGLLALAVGAVIQQISISERGSSWFYECLLDGGLILLATALAATWSRSKTIPAALIISLLTYLPFALANLANVTSNLCLLNGFDDDGLRALISSLLITAWGFAAASAGGVLGYRLRQVQPHN